MRSTHKKTQRVTLYSEDMQHGQLVEGQLTTVNPLKT